MVLNSVEIIPFQDGHQPDIDKVMDSIAAEYEESIYSPQFKKLKDIAILSGHTYWVARSAGKVVGTIGLLAMENNNVELKRFFLAKEFRGQGVSKMLLDKVLAVARERGYRRMFLGTMSQFKAAQAFYTKNNFTRIPRESLPPDFLVNPVDKVFFTIDIS